MSTTADIWYCRPGGVRNPDLIDSYKELLSAPELARYRRFWFDRDRHLHLVAWALVRTTLSRYADVAPEAWEFRANKYGRPEIAAPRIVPDLRFNLSHTRGLIACIVADGVDVGIDVEDRRRDTPGLDIARRYFSPREVKNFESYTDERRQDAFFEYWTLKEAYIKAIGVGISVGLGRFSFELDERGLDIEDPDRRPPLISFHEGLDDDAEAWQFAQFEPTACHAMAAAIRCGDGRAFDIHLQEVVPGLDDA